MIYNILVNNIYYNIIIYYLYMCIYKQKKNLCEPVMF